MLAGRPAEAGSATASTLDLHDPEGGISDPTAPLAPLNRDCRPGQVDVNTASGGDIAQAFGLESGPTVDRIIDLRPWLRTVDITSVPGVGPSKASVLATNGCATPEQIPEAAPLACTRDEQVDLQAASVAELRRSLQLSTTTAEAIVRQRPIPQDLYQIAAPRTPGLGPGRIRELLASASVCVTPAPTTFRGTDYRFVYPDAGAVIGSTVDPRFALIVPPGAAEAATFAKVTPLDGQDLPTADFHLYGSFTGLLAIRLPDVGLGEPVVFHDADDGVRLSSGSGVVAEDGGTIVAAVSSLSEASSSSVDPACLSGLSYSTFCSPTSSLDQLLLDRFSTDAASTAAQMNEAQRRLPAADGECYEPWTLLVSDGSVPLGVLCSATMSGDEQESTWTFENIFAGEFLVFESAAAPYFIDVSGGAAPRSAYSTSPGATNNGTYSGPVSRRLADFGIVVPGHARSFTKRAGDPATVVTSTGANPAVLAVTYALLNVTEVLDSVSDLTGGGEFVGALVNCVGILGHARPSVQIAKDLLSCVVAAAELKIQNRLDNLDGRTTEARRLKNAKGILARFALVPSLAEFGASFISNLLDGSSFNEQQLAFRHLLPSPPAPGSGGSSGTPVPGGGIDGSLPAGAITNAIIKLENNAYHAEFTYGGDYVGHAILDVPTYACLTRRYLVRDWLPWDEYLDHIRQNSQYEATCDDSVPEFVAGPGSRNFILRQLDGESFHLGPDGKVRPILDGTTYICLAQRVFVLDNRTDAEIASYPQAPIPQVATCS